MHSLLYTVTSSFEVAKKFIKHGYWVFKIHVFDERYIYIYIYSFSYSFFKFLTIHFLSY